MVETERGWSPAIQELLDHFLRSITLAKRVEFTHLLTSHFQCRPHA
jgi:hypothetical protein